VPYLGFGPSAHSFFRQAGNEIRCANVPRLSAYLETPLAVEDFRETLSEIDRFNEIVLLSLRRREGLALELLRKNFNFAAMNKQRGTLTTTSDEHARKTVYDDLRPFLSQVGISERLFAVGRLDKDTDGLLIFTNDTHFADFLTNPEHHIPKTYRAKLARPISDSDLQTLRQGVKIEARGKSYLAKPFWLERLTPRVVELVLTEGKNREVRRLFDAIGNKVERLTRLKVGNLSLDALNLQAGETRLVQKHEIWDDSRNHQNR